MGYPQIIHFHRIFSINHLFWGTPYFRKRRPYVKIFETINETINEINLNDETRWIEYETYIWIISTWVCVCIYVKYMCIYIYISIYIIWKVIYIILYHCIYCCKQKEGSLFVSIHDIHFRTGHMLISPGIQVVSEEPMHSLGPSVLTQQCW